MCPADHVGILHQQLRRPQLIAQIAAEGLQMSGKAAVENQGTHSATLCVLRAWGLKGSLTAYYAVVHASPQADVMIDPTQEVCGSLGDPFPPHHPMSSAYQNRADPPSGSPSDRSARSDVDRACRIPSDLSGGSRLTGGCRAPGVGPPGARFGAAPRFFAR
ncbi:hypothetical protein Pmi06nite_02660 [Planotetraspora mira]|uniref:Uncharacterized protein n=1 Tax=Planotetraspora mira TaxID=58121 RepID=A0A8J3X4P1_9ACTN|nr:hypothetical protein Pmi06nite_02660 [Planotetraspora mira]